MCPVHACHSRTLTGPQTVQWPPCQSVAPCVLLSARCRVATQRSRFVVTAGAIRSANRERWSEQGGNIASAVEPAQPTPAATTASPPAAGQSVWKEAARLQGAFFAIEFNLVAGNLQRVQTALRRARVGPHHFAGSTGYGHGDLGRAALDEVMAEVMGAEAALVRAQFVSGTHAIATALFAVLRPGDELLAVAGKPYDTLEEVIGLRGTPGHGSLREWGVSYRELPLTEDGQVDLGGLEAAVRGNHRLRVALIQRSCGYALRPTLSIADIREAVAVIKGANPGVVVVVDNCYGEFTEDCEPCAAGADLAAGSLIKSPGGTIVPGGGYVAGRADLVAAAAARLTAPGVGTDAGCVSGTTLRLMFQGLFLAPQMVGEALKGGRLVAAVMEGRGFRVTPGSHALPAGSRAQDGASARPSFITAVQLGSAARMVAFCRAVQRSSPVGAYVQPVPGATPGYSDEVIFGDGTFIDGSTAELSADGPLRPPYVVYCQGGTHWTHWAHVLEAVIDALEELSEPP